MTNSRLHLPVLLVAALAGSGTLVWLWQRDRTATAPESAATRGTAVRTEYAGMPSPSANAVGTSSPTDSHAVHDAAGNAPRPAALASSRAGSASVATAAASAGSAERAEGGSGPDAPVERRPAEWGLSGSRRESYTLRSDAGVVWQGAASAVLRARDRADSIGFGTLVQVALADGFRGHKVRFNARLRTERAFAGATLWLRADDAQGVSVAFDNLGPRRWLRGTNDWTEVGIVLDVPKDAAVLVYGAFLQGGGTLWVDDASLRIVDPGVEATSPPYRRRPELAGYPRDLATVAPTPRNLDFEATVAVGP